MLAQESPRSWTTTILIAESPPCLTSLNLTYELVTTSPDYLINGIPTGTAAVVPVTGASASLNPITLRPLDRSHLAKACSQAAGADSEVSLKFTLASPFPTIPLGVTLVVDDPGGPVPAAAVQLMTVHRLVTFGQYLGCPLAYGGIMAGLLLIGVAGLSFLPTRKKGKASGRGFLRNPVYASAAWTFADSPATNITTVGTILVAILAAAGTVSTLLPGVQLDRFAILMAVCAAIIAMAPLWFGIFNSRTSGSRPEIPQNAGLVLPNTTIDAPGGASVTFTDESAATGQDLRRLLRAGATVPVPPRSKISVGLAARGLAVFPGDTSILLRSVRSVTIEVEEKREITIPSDALRLPSDWPIAAPGRPIVRFDSGPEIRIGSVAKIEPDSGKESRPDSGKEIQPVQGEDVTVKANGFVEFKVPAGTRLMDPTMIDVSRPGSDGGPGKDKGRTFPYDTWVRVPLAGDKEIVADMRSLLPAIMLSIFGIGAEFGLLTVLGGELSAEPRSVHVAVIVVIALLAVFVLAYTTIRTKALASTTSPGSSLAPDAKTAIMP